MFKKLIRDTIRPPLPESVQKELDKRADKIRNVEDLSLIINSLYARYGSTLQYHFMMFTYGGKLHRWKEKVGLLWYNASYEYEDVKKALLSWQGHLSPEAKVVLRGYDQPGVVKVIKEYLGAYGNFIFVDSVGTTAILQVDGCVHYWVIGYNEFGICKYCGRKRNFKRLSRESSEIETKRRANGRKSK